MIWVAYDVTFHGLFHYLDLASSRGAWRRMVPRAPFLLCKSKEMKMAVVSSWDNFCNFTLFSCSLLLICSLTSSFEILASVSGELQEGAVKHYKVMQRKDEILACVLFSDEGDGDLYIATNREVNMDTNDFDYSSSSFGTDVMVVVNEDGKDNRKLDVVVFAHPRYTTTVYRLYVIRCEDSDLERYSVKETWPNEDGTITVIHRKEFADPLAIANDQVLVNIVYELKTLGYYHKSQANGYDQEDGTPTGWGPVLLKIIEFVIEVLV